MNPFRDEAAALLARAMRHASQYLETIHERHVGATASGDDLRRLLGRPLSEHGEDSGDVVDDLARAAQNGTTASQGPRYFGFVTGGSLPVATAVDWLVSAWDQNAQVYVMSPLASVVEAIASDWLKEVLDYQPCGAWALSRELKWRTSPRCSPRATIYCDTSAGMLNATDCSALPTLTSSSAMSRIARSSPHYGCWASEANGCSAWKPMTKAGCVRIISRRYCGGDRDLASCVRRLAMSTPAQPIHSRTLRRCAALEELGSTLTRRSVSGLRPVSRCAISSTGVDQADSIATDAHEWLNVPYDSGIVLTAHPESHQRGLMVPAHYIQMTQGERDPRAFTPDESRRARGVAVYAALRTLGRRGVSELVERCCRHARRMAEALHQHVQVRLLNDVVLNQVLVQFVPLRGDLRDESAFTMEVVAGVQRDGTCWLGSTQWKGRRAMRISICNWSTTEPDIDRSAAAILRVVERLNIEGVPPGTSSRVEGVLERIAVASEGP